MRSIRLPNDLQEYVRKRAWKRISKCLTFEAGVILFLFFLGNRIFSALGILLQSLVYVILLFLPFLLTGVPFKMMDKDWSGTVTNVKIKTKTAYTADYQYLQNIIILTLVDANGKSFKKTVASHNVQTSKPGGAFVSYSDAKVEHYINDYAIGDEVYHFHGLPYPFVIGPNYKERTTCMVCGQETKSDQAHCWSCGHSLIKIK